MSINRSEQTLETRLTNKVTELERQLIDLKAKAQPIGGDTLLVDKLPSGATILSTSFTMGAGSSTNVLVEVEPFNDTLTLHNMFWNIYVDTDALTHDWPVGSSLTVDQISDILAMPMWNWARSDDTTNKRVFVLHIRNIGAVSHTIYFKFKDYLPKLTGSTVS